MIEPLKVIFLVLPDFHMMALSAAIEPLRLANLVSEQKLTQWKLCSLGDSHVKASNEMEVAVEGSVYDFEHFDMLLVCASFRPESQGDSRLFAWLRRLNRAGKFIGAMDTGTIVLARAGLLDGVRVTANYNVLDGLIERYPKLNATDHLYEIDGNKVTCAGGTAPMDMMLFFVRERFGLDLAARISSHMFHERIRGSEESQIYAVRHHGLNIAQEVRLAIDSMERNIETPISIEEVSTDSGSSVRRLQRLFRKYFHLSPMEFYMRLRLERARQYLAHTEMSVLNTAVACGFTSQEHFARRFKRTFGRSPLEERKLNRDQVVSDMKPVLPFGA